MTDADLSAIRDIYNHYVRSSVVTFDEEESTVESWTAKRVLLAARGLPFLVAEEDDRVLGYALAQPWSAKSAYRYTVENSIYLAPDAAGRGLGRRLLADFLDACRAAGLRQVIAVIADEGAEASIALHRKAGFADAGALRGVGVKFGRDLGVVFLQLSLDAPG
ncbi:MULTISPECIES: GNAT family N-acetyltransferase [Microbacterium]|uniref:GNAT family N-acetyltransferase n=1 Tax=Microbacterium TaxID=33882 RepID=UPI00217DCE8C|nr:MULTISPECIES: GNAT family N-acetyltransferase [Microbacterium]